jgi:precorrin-6x reductase
MHVVPDTASAVQVCQERGSRIFVTSGTKTLAAFRDVMARKWVMARILPTVTSLTQAAVECDIPVVVISRPGLHYPHRYHDLEDAVQAVMSLMHTHQGTRASHPTLDESSSLRSPQSSALIE